MPGKKLHRFLFAIALSEHCIIIFIHQYMVDVEIIQQEQT